MKGMSSCLLDEGKLIIQDSRMKTVNEVFISLLVVVSVIFPGDIYNLKKILFLFICLINIRVIFTSMFNYKNFVMSFYGFAFPIILILYSILLTDNIAVSFSRSFASFLLLIIYVVNSYKIPFERILINAIKIIMLATLILVFLDLIGAMDVNSGFFKDNIMYRFEIGLMGKSIDYPFYYKIFFRTSPLMVILLFKSFSESKYLIFMLTSIAILVSGTRGNVLFSFGFLCLFYITNTGNKSKIIKYLLISSMAILTILFSSTIYQEFYQVFFVKGTTSDVIRQGHIRGILELINNNPWIILTGSGMGSDFYSYGVNGYINSIEWSFIDLWRQMGFFLFSLFIIFLLLPLLSNNGGKIYKKYAYMTYLFIAATNPLLFSSTAYLVYIYMYYDLSKSNNLIINEDVQIMKRVDILLAVYRPDLQYLEKLLSSLNNQNYPNLNLIIRDDSADEASYIAISALLKKCITKFPYNLIRNDKNYGSNRTFELLTQDASGSYIAYCDQDDIWESDKIAKLVNCIENGSALLCYSDLAIIDTEDKIIAKSFKDIHKRLKHKHGSNLFEYFLRRNSVTGCTMLINSEVAKKAIPFCHEFYVHDHWLTLYASALGKIAYIPEPLVRYRIHGGNQIGAGMLKGIVSKEDYYNKKLLVERAKFEYLLKRYNFDEKSQELIRKLIGWTESRIRFFDKLNVLTFFSMVRKLKDDYQLITLEILINILPKHFSQAVIARYRR